MCDVIEIAFGARWTVPVRVMTDAGPADIRGPQEAYMFLRDHWPRRGPCYRAARRHCVRALARQASPEAGRRAFVVAGREAGMLA